MSAPSPYLEATDIFETDHPTIRALVDPLVRAATGEPDLARRVFELARDSVEYSPYVEFHLREHYRATVTLERGRGYCVQKAVLLVTLARAAGIGARLVFVDMRNHRAPAHLQQVLSGNLFVYHCYGTLRVAGRWLEATPAFDRGICERYDLPLVRFDGHESAIFPPVDDQGRRYVEYVTEHGVFDDVPMEPMLAAWRRAYGADRVEQWKQTLSTGGRME